jgi:hypothetical protein
VIVILCGCTNGTTDVLVIDENPNAPPDAGPGGRRAGGHGGSSTGGVGGSGERQAGRSSEPSMWNCDRWEPQFADAEMQLLDSLNDDHEDGSFCVPMRMIMNASERCGARFVAQQLQLDFGSGRPPPGFPQPGWSVYPDSQVLWAVRGAALPTDARAAILDNNVGYRAFCASARQLTYQNVGIGHRDDVWAIVFDPD